MRIFLAILSLSLLLSASQAFAKVDKVELITLFSNNRCGELTPKAVSASNFLESYGYIDLQIEYMLAACRCRQPGTEGLQLLPKIFRNMSPSHKNYLRTNAARCRLGENLTRWGVPPLVASVSGKGGGTSIFDPNFKEEKIIFFEKNQISAAWNHLKSRGFDNILVSKDFILSGDLSLVKLKNHRRLIADTLNILANQFGLRKPRNLVTIYLYENRTNFERKSIKLHNISASNSTWAYTYPKDSSLSIWIGGGMGTIGHEIFHLLFDHNAPYAPPWLNEGLAALFEESETSKNRDSIRSLFRLDHWRVKYVNRGGWVDLPKLLRMDWSELDRNRDVYHAQAKFFLMYLQELGVAKKLIKKYSNLNIFSVPRSNVVLKNILKVDEKIMTTNFNNWLRKKVGIVNRGVAAPTITLVSSSERSEAQSGAANGRTQQWYIDRPNQQGVKKFRQISATSRKNFGPSGRALQYYIDQYKRTQQHQYHRQLTTNATRRRHPNPTSVRAKNNDNSNGRTQQWYIDQYNRELATNETRQISPNPASIRVDNGTLHSHKKNQFSNVTEHKHVNGQLKHSHHPEN